MIKIRFKKKLKKSNFKFFSGPWALGHGPWAMGHGPWAMGHGPWAMGPGPWALGHGPWALGHGPLRFIPVPVHTGSRLTEPGSTVPGKVRKFHEWHILYAGALERELIGVQGSA